MTSPDLTKANIDRITELFPNVVTESVDADGNPVPDEAAILAFCRDHLASYKRPKTLSIVDELPRNTMGKLLKRELREPYWKGRERNV